MKNEKEKQIVVIGVVNISLLFSLFFSFSLSLSFLSIFRSCAKHMFTLVLVIKFLLIASTDGVNFKIFHPEHHT